MQREHGVRIEAADVEHPVDGGVAEAGHAEFGARVHVLQTVGQRHEFIAVGEIGLREHEAVREADLFLRLRMLVELRLAVVRVDERHDAVEPVVRTEVGVGQQRLHDRRGLREAGRLDDDAVERDLAGGAALLEIDESALQVAADRAAEAAVLGLDDLLGGVAHQELAVDVHLAEFVLDHGEALAVLFG